MSYQLQAFITPDFPIVRSKEDLDRFKYYVTLAHLPPSIRVDAAWWAYDTFGKDRVDIWRPHKGEDGQFIPAFWFTSEEDTVCFSLRWL